MDRCELLSPAGDYDCFLAAVSAGADAVYLGLDRFSARASAHNLTEPELLSALDIAHIRGVKVYLTVNTLFKDDELCDLYDMLYEPYKRGLDAVIVQDIGAMKMIASSFPDLAIHVSTQAAVTSSEGAMYLKDLGVSRIVPARELTLCEITKLKDDTGMELECFIHGSMCYSYSGKCLLSSFIGGRSGNRGRCAQPCRLKYDDEYMLSLSDLCCVDLIPELIGAGISSFKIEGRAKSAGYVHNVTSIYRKYIDAFYENGKCSIDKNDMDSLIGKYSRGKTGKGYYHIHNDRKMITLDSPSYAENEDDKPCDINVAKVPVKMSVTIRRNEPVKVMATACGKTITHIDKTVAESAKNAPLTAESVTKQFSKLGDTQFVAADISVSADDGLFITNGVLNCIRRDAIDELSSCILSPCFRKEPDLLSHEDDIYYDRDDNNRPHILAQVLTIEQAGAVLDTDTDGIIVPAYVYKELTKDMRSLLCGRKLYISLPLIIRNENRDNSPQYVKELIKRASADDDVAGFYISNLESAKLIRDSSFSGEVIGDIHLYAYNRHAASYYKNHGISKTTVPVELNYRELVNRKITGEDLIVYGRLPMMISANCIINTKEGCRSDKNGHGTYISDRKGMKMFAFCNCRDCTNTLYNSVKLCLTDDKRLFDLLHPSSIRFVFTDEDPDTVRYVLRSYRDQADDKGVTAAPLTCDHTRGHINRGVY